MQNRENFGSNTVAIMALAGSAIGLGNIWRFPYMVGEHGGAAFIVIYLLASLLLSLPIMMSETVIGRRSHSNTFGAMRSLAPGSKWHYLGLLTVISPLIILSYYSVVGGWSIDYLLRSLTGSFLNKDASLLSAEFAGAISSPLKPIIFQTVFLLACALVVSAGVKSGIERFNKLTIPLLFVLILAIMIYSLTLPGAMRGVEYLVKPDFSKISPSTVSYAVGQSFFSLSLGVGTVLTYSSYIGKRENILMSGLGTTVFDLLFALIAGFAIMPAVFAAGIEPGAGPGLIFETLPFIFSSMGEATPILSSVVAVLFFVTICVAALTSAISMYEVGVAYLVEEKGVGRKKAVWLLFAGIWSLGALCSLSFGALSGVKIFGLTIFNFCDTLTSNFLMMFGALLFVLFAGWKMKKGDVRDEFSNGGKFKFNDAVFGTFYFLLKYVAPVGMVIIFVTNFIGS